MTTGTLESELEQFYHAHRKKHLIKRVDEATELLEVVLLLYSIQEILLSDPLAPDEDAQVAVQTVQDAIEVDDFQELDDRLPEALERLEAERDDVRSALRRHLRDVEDRIGGLEALNRRVERVEAQDIRDLSGTAESIMDVPLDQDEPFEERNRRVRRNTRQFVTDLKTVQNAMFKEFRGSDIAGLVRALIRGEDVKLSSQSGEELVALRESTFGPYVELTLEGE